MACARGVVGVVTAAMLLAGCESGGPSAGQVVGPLVGGGGGAVVGHVLSATTHATVVGAAVGAVVGLALGTLVDPPARAKVAEAAVKAAEDGTVGQPVAWHTDKSSGSMTPTGPAYADHGRTCRPLHQDETVAGTHAERDVTACRDAAGTWVVVEAEKAHTSDDRKS